MFGVRRRSSAPSASGRSPGRRCRGCTRTTGASPGCARRSGTGTRSRCSARSRCRSALCLATRRRVLGTLLVYGWIVAIALTYSRGGVIVAVLAVVAWIVLSRAWAEALATLVAAGLPAAVVIALGVLARRRDERRAVALDPRERRRDLRRRRARWARRRGAARPRAAAGADADGAPRRARAGRGASRRRRSWSARRTRAPGGTRSRARR